MREPYIICDPPDATGSIHISSDEANHLTRVLRLGMGARFIGTDGDGHGWRCEITEVTKRNVLCNIIEELPPEPARSTISIAVGSIKGPRMEWAVEKAAELGAAHFVPLKTRYSVVDPGGGRSKRWANIAVAAAKQSKRLTLMSISSPVSIGDLQFQSFNQIFIFDLTDDAKEPVEAFEQNRLVLSDTQNREILLIIGPEGGFSDEERDLFRSVGAHFVSLGDHPLRTESAVAAGLTLINALMPGI